MEIGLESWLNLMTQDKEEEAAAFNSELEADMDLISLIDISKHYEMGDQTVNALSSVTVHIAKNDYLAFIGSSGSGKSTLLSFANLLEDSHQGDILFAGEPVRWKGQGSARKPADAAQVLRIRTQLSMVFQQFNLFPHMTVLENCIVAPIWVKGVPRAEAEAHALKYLELILGFL